MRVRLHILKYEDARDYSEGRHLRFAVVDLDRSKEYPANFLCLLPTRLSFSEKKPNAFEKTFGSQSFDVAKKLLTDALKKEDDEDTRVEIERRVKLLNPESARDKTCPSCGKTFRPNPKKKTKQRYCEDCLKRKYGSRD